MPEIWLEKVSLMFIEDEAKVTSRVGGVKCGFVYHVKLLFESDECEFSFGGIES